MIKENFIKLYENSFRENWDLPCYTDYGENTQYTYGQVAEEIARLHLLFKHCTSEEEIRSPLSAKIMPIGASPIWQQLHTEQLLSLSYRTFLQTMFTILSTIPNQLSYSPVTIFGIT